MKLRYTILWVVALLVFGLINVLIVQREMLISQGEAVFLELAPVDPRSLIQGDYMDLRYALAREVSGRDDLPSDGQLVITLDEDNIARFVRVYDGQTPLAPNERLLRYRRRDQDVRLGAESFFFQEGQADAYSQARYAELRIAESGESILVDLRGPNLELLGSDNGSSD